MSFTQGARGGTAAIVWAVDALFDAAPVLTIRSNATLAYVPVVPPVASNEVDTYTAVWSIPALQAIGSYTATLTGDVLGEPATEVATVYVSGGTPYMDVAEFKSALMPGETTSTADVRILGVLSGVSRAIDRECGRSFACSALTARKFDIYTRAYTRASGDGVLHVDDIAYPEDPELIVTTGYGTYTAVTDFEIERDDVTQDAPGVCLTLYNDSWRSRGTRALITARWGWAAPPDAVIEACLIQATRIFARKGAPEGIAGPAEWGLTRQPRLDVDVRTMLAGLQKAPMA